MLFPQKFKNLQCLKTEAKQIQLNNRILNYEKISYQTSL